MGGPRRLKLEQLERFELEHIKKEWARLYGVPAPALSPDLLRMGLAYRIQEKQQGGLDRAALAFLRRSTEKHGNRTSQPRRKLAPDARLVRDWHGTGHSVTVLEDGFEYDGRQWKSLSAIACAITGTKWNGPRFFGLTGKKR